MLFRLVTIIYFTVLGKSLTHTSLFSTKYSISILLLNFSASHPPPPLRLPPPLRPMRAWEYTRLICLTRKLRKKRHMVTEYDKYLICESNFSPCQNDGFAAKTLIRAKAIPQDTQYIQYPKNQFNDQLLASLRRWCCLRSYFRDRIEKRRHVNEEVYRALSYPDTLLGENHSFSLRLSTLKC